MADDRSGVGPTLSVPAARRHDQLCDDFEAALRNASSVRIEDVLSEVPLEERRALFAALLGVAIEVRRPSAADWEEYKARFPEFDDLLEELRHEPAGESATSGEAPLPE